MSFSFEPLTLTALVVTRPAAPVPPARGQVPAPDESVVVRLQLPELDRAAVAQRMPQAASGVDVTAALEQAKGEAYRLGFAEGRRAEESRVASAVESVQALIAHMERLDERRKQEASERIAVLATAVACHLVEREVRASPDVIADVVRRAVAEFPVTDQLIVRLNPSDLALLSGAVAEDSIHQHLTGGQAVRWIADPSVRSGGCLVEGTERIVDARLSRALERICEVLTDA